MACNGGQPLPIVEQDPGDVSTLRPRVGPGAIPDVTLAYHEPESPTKHDERAEHIRQWYERTNRAEDRAVRELRSAHLVGLSLACKYAESRGFTHASTDFRDAYVTIANESLFTASDLARRWRAMATRARRVQLDFRYGIN